MLSLTLGRLDQFKCFIYRNLNDKCWSVKALEGQHKGRVVFHAQYLAVGGGANASHLGPERADITFKVSQAGRERVLREKCKNVHAGIVGYVYHAIGVNVRYDDVIPTRELFEIEGEYDFSRDITDPDHPAYRQITYNPYKNDRFVFADTLEEAIVIDSWNQDIILDPAGKVYIMDTRILCQMIQTDLDQEAQAQ